MESKPTVTSGPLITHWPHDAAARFTHETLVVAHNLHEHAMFRDAGLASLLDRYPRDKLGVFTMGHDPVDWRSWAAGRAGDLSGAQLLADVHAGRIWLNLRAANHYLEDYDALSNQIFADKHTKMRGLRTLKHDLGVLISSPNAQVFYHLDSALVSLWQVRGNKSVRIYEPTAPFARPEQIEAVVLRETAEQMPFDLTWDDDAQQVILEPGMMVTWPQNAPHRIVNGDMVNVSLSVEFMTPAALLRANVIYANGVLRRRFGVTPHIQKGYDLRALTKFGAARVFKALHFQKAHEYKLPKTFDLTKAVPGQAA